MQMQMKTKWLKDAVFYEIYPPSFFDSNGDGISDIRGMTAKLDYIYQSFQLQRSLDQSMVQIAVPRRRI